MQQTVLLAADWCTNRLVEVHPVKTLCRWLRRCYLISAFDKCVLDDPYDSRGGSFVGAVPDGDCAVYDHAAQLLVDTRG